MFPRTKFVIFNQKNLLNSLMVLNSASQILKSISSFTRFQFFSPEISTESPVSTPVKIARPFLSKPSTFSFLVLPQISAFFARLLRHFEFSSVCEKNSFKVENFSFEVMRAERRGINYIINFDFTSGFEDGM